MDQLAAEGRDVGMNWSAGSISAIERGNFKPTLDVLIALAAALGELLHPEDDDPGVSIDELVETPGLIQITDNRLMNTNDLLVWLAGRGLYFRPDPEMVAKVQRMVNEQFKRINTLHLPELSMGEFKKLGTTTAGEERLAKRAEIDPLELKAWAHHLWGMSIEDQRDQQAGPNSTPQKKGRVSRELIAEIKAAMADDQAGVNGND